MAIYGCGSLACCCQPAVAAGFIYADLRSEFSTHLAPQALFIQSSPVHEPLLQAFPFPSTLGEVRLHPLSQASVFIYSSHGKWAFSSLLWSFPPTTAFTSFPAPCFWACATAPVFFCPACLFTVPWGIPLPHLQQSGFPTLFATCLFFVIAYYSVSLFFPGWGSVCPGGYADLAQCCLWEYHVPLSSPCSPCLPKPSGHWCLVAAQESSWFLCLTWSGDALCRPEVKVLPFLSGFSCKVYLQHLSKILL
jgi:hypothetical protein